MNHVWWTIVTFFQKLFVPPEYTTLERELLRQISHLEGEVFKERAKYSELTERLLFPAAGPVLEQTSTVNYNVANAAPSPSQRANELERLSHQRWRERAELIAQEAELKIKNRDSNVQA